jgi:hypothetical protein
LGLFGFLLAGNAGHEEGRDHNCTGYHFDVLHAYLSFRWVSGLTRHIGNLSSKSNANMLIC